MRTQIFALAFALAPVASAIGWSDVLPDVDAVVVRRQDTPKPTDGAQQTPSPSPTNGNSPTGTGPTTKGPNTTADLNTGGNTPTGSQSGGSTGTSKGSGTQTSTKTKAINPQDPAGGATMVTPGPLLGMQLYRIEESTPLTWVWNYTAVQAKPTAIDVLISCQAASQTITLTQNMTYNNPQTFTWDHAKYAETEVAKNLRTEKYTLIVYDAATNPTDVAPAGHLGPWSQYIFGLYASQPYTDLADGWQCVSCSGAYGSLERTAIGFATSMSIITILSFTWFVGGFGAML